jgi:hypothetical protein
VLSFAEPAIVEMVDTGKVNIRVAAEAVRTTDRATQAGWTEADVKRVGGKILASYPSKLPNAVRKPARVKPQAPTRIDIPYKTIRFPTPEETGYPVNGTMNQKDDFCEKYGRTPLHPMDIRDLNDALAAAGEVLSAIIVAGSKRLDAATFLAYIERLQARKPQRDGELNYAARARTLMEKLKEALPRAVALVNGLHDALAEPVPPNDGHAVEQPTTLL